MERRIAKWWSACALALLAGPAVLQASEPTASEGADDIDAWRELARMIVRQPEPRHRLLGAFQLAMHRGEATDAPDAADSAIAGAAFADMRVGSTDPWVLVMAAGACPFDAAQCDRAGAARDLGRLQPDNAAAWLPTLEQAVAARDDTAIDATLARMAAASHWTDAFADTVRVALDAFDAVASMAQGAALLAEASGLDAGAISKRRDPLAATYAMGVALAVSMPSLQPVSTACKDDVVDARARRAACRVVARHLMDSNTAVGQRLGAAQARRLAVDDAEREGIEAFVHRLDWQMEALVEVMRALDGAVAREITDNDLRFFRSWREAWIRSTSESEVTATLLAEAGIPLDPPVSYRPPERR